MCGALPPTFWAPWPPLGPLGTKLHVHLQIFHVCMNARSLFGFVSNSLVNVHMFQYIFLDSRSKFLEKPGFRVLEAEWFNSHVFFINSCEIYSLGNTFMSVTKMSLK